MKGRTPVHKPRARRFGFRHGGMNVIDNGIVETAANILQRCALHRQVEIETKGFPIPAMAVRNAHQNHRIVFVSRRNTHDTA
jgi:hypothetical protein